MDATKLQQMINAAESSVSANPTDGRGFANSAMVEVYDQPWQNFRSKEEHAAAKKDASARAIAAITSAGYAWSDEKKRYERGGFFAAITVSDRIDCAIWIYASERVALAIGAEGYLPPGDR